MLKTTVTKIFKFEAGHQLKECYSTENNTFTCPVCGKDNLKSFFTHITKKPDKEHLDFQEKFDNEITNVIDYMANDYLQIEINKELQKYLPFLTPIVLANRIRNRIKELGLDYRKVMGEKRKGLNNPIHKNPTTIKKISNSVKKKWSEGAYDKRINGMLGRIGELNPNFDASIHTIEERGQRCFSDFLREFQDISVCNCCGKNENKINIHHIDEDRTNFLPSNLEPLCVPCHMSYHYSHSKKPYVKIGKYFKFSAAHELPNHKGLCQYIHGHEWKVGIELKKRINNQTGMVIDFSDLKKIVNTHVISVLDHSFLNEIIYNPTAENLLIWIWEKLMFDGLLKGIHKIELWESSDSVAVMDEKGMRSVLMNKEKLGELNMIFLPKNYNQPIIKE